MSIRADIPLVCICIPTYNAAATIRETLASIVNQSYSNLDIQIVDNASTDETLKIVAEFDDPRIRILRNEINIGAEGNFNRCIQLATGKYTAIFHADDIYEPGMVQRQVEFLELNPEAGAVFTEASLIDESGKVFGAVKLPKELSSSDHLYVFLQLFKTTLHQCNYFICPSAMVKTNIYQDEIKCWRGELFKSSSDLDVWLRILLQHPVGMLPNPLMRYRVSKFQFSAHIRAQVDRTDFFLVMDYYLAQQGIQNLLTEDDRLHYRWLERTERIRRAVNYFMCNQINEANHLCGTVITLDALHAAFDSKQGLLTLLKGIFLKFFILLKLHSLGKKLLIFARNLGSSVF